MPKYCSTEVKEVIVRARQFFEEEKENGGPTIPVQKVVERTAEAVGVSTATVKRVTAEYKRQGTVEICKPKTGRKRIACDEFLQGVIRRKMLNFYMEKKFPTVKELHSQIVGEVPDLPQFSERTLYTWLRKLHFSFKKLTSKPVLMESQAISAQRADFLTALQRYRNGGWKIYYTDETWCGANHSRKFGWVEKVQPEKRDNFDQYRGGVQEVNGYRGGIKRPSGAGQRVIILHIGSEDGFLPGCMKCFIGEKKKAKADYHHEMNRQHFEEWYRHVLSIIPAKSVVVIDQAPYHTMLDPDYKNPTSSWRKDDVIAWLKKKNVPLPVDVTAFSMLRRPQLLQLSKPHHNKKVLLLDSITQQLRGNDVKLLWLPVAHCEFNAIELIWAYVKNKVAKENTTFKINDVLNLCREAMNTVPTVVWQNCVEHCKQIEQVYIQKDHIVDDTLEQFLINVDDDEDDDDDAVSSSDSTTEEGYCDSQSDIEEDTQFQQRTTSDDASCGGPSGIAKSGRIVANVWKVVTTLPENVPGRMNIGPEPL